MSQQKAEANRANSRKSTGPTTPRGKNVSKFNALKHGGYVQRLFIDEGKHLPEYERFKQLSDEMQQQMLAGAYLEDKVLVQKFVTVVWRLELITRLEFAVAAEGGAAALSESLPSFSHLIAHALRDFERTYEQVQKLRQRVEEAGASEAEPVAGLSASAETAPEGETSGGDGRDATGLIGGDAPDDGGKRDALHKAASSETSLGPRNRNEAG